jgi:N-glycosylase/DNA lyase
MNKTVLEVKEIYKKKKKDFERRLADFRRIRRSGDDRAMLHELIFCIFTPQSKAVNCWRCVTSMIENRLMMDGTAADLLKLKEMNLVRFKNKKAQFAVLARDQFIKDGEINIKSFLNRFKDANEMREWLVNNIKGYGYKEASHFLRNIGFGEDIAILDRHILKNLKLMGAIKSVPGSLTPAFYLETERKMKVFAKRIKVPMAALDLILWYKEAGHIFK